MIRIGIAGACGKMGSFVTRTVHAQEDMEVVAAIDAKDSDNIGRDIGEVIGIGSIGVTVTGSDKLGETLGNVDVLVDFTTTKSAVENVKTAASKRVKLVVGTTGFSDAQRKEMLDAIKENNVAMVIAPNMSVGVNIFFKMTGELAKLLKNYDVEVIEAHHRFKKDAPSGTAAKAAQIIAESRNKNIKNIGVYGRQGECSRSEGEIGIHAIRAGDITGEHTILFGGTGERIEFTHRAHSRDAFAQGVPLAIRYAMKAKPGVYDMQDVLDLK